MKQKFKNKISEFFKEEYVDQASYDNLRKIASVVDGQKNASRKVITTLIDKNITSEAKVSQLSSKVEEYTEYLHGSIAGVLINMAQDYTGTNNLPLVLKSGSFGTRHEPAPSAARYIFASASKTLLTYFSKQDKPNLVKQYFEGSQIEPQYYVPTLPMLLINGAEGTSSGFSQKILPRNPAEIKKLILNLSDGGNRRPKLNPYYDGFTGDIIQGDNPLQWLIQGIVKRKNQTTVEITEIPVGYSLKDYLKILDKLEDDKFIKSYVDKSENDKFHFLVSFTAKDLKALTDNELLKKLKLIKTVTENYTCINEHNKIELFDSVIAMAKAFLRVKNEYMIKRKDSMIVQYQKDLEVANSMYLFIQMVTSDKLIINKRKRAELIKEMMALDKFYLVDGKLDYLLNLNISKLTIEEMKKLKELATKAKADLKLLKSTAPTDLLIADIEQI